MQLEQILENIDYQDFIPGKNKEINNLQFDSRNVSDRDAFFAVNGYNVNGHKFIDKAIDKGAKTIFCEKLPENLRKDINWILVKDSQIALGHSASAFYNFPSKNLKIIGITGTNGKSSIVTLLFNLIRNFGYECGLISTVVNKIGKHELKSTHTTPNAIELQQLFSKMVESGCEYCFMEVSSHSIHQNRIAGTKFLAGIFTNLTHEHLDYHKTFAEYRDTKKMFFDNLNKESFVLTNTDDKNGNFMIQNTMAHIKKYSMLSPSEYKIRIIEKHFDGMLLSINKKEFWTKLTGDFNAYNIAAVYGIAVELGLQKEEILEKISSLDSVRGRFEYENFDEEITGIVDYAHSPDALKNVLKTIISVKTNAGRIITVFGAGGDRDKSKRPEMGKIASQLSDFVILTSDNPRTEDPEKIIDDIEKGLTRGCDFVRITSRKDAIRTAAFLAKRNDILLIAGKGHETYQEIKGIRHSFDDLKVLKEVFAQKKLNKN